MDKKNIITLQGKDFVTYEGLIDELHRQGLMGVSTQLLQVPDKDNSGVAIVQAQITMRSPVGEDGTFLTRQFTGIGDAGPASLKSNMVPAAVRMAETRAIARAARLATNIGMTAFEELGSDGPSSEATISGKSTPSASPEATVAPKSTPKATKTTKSAAPAKTELYDQIVQSIKERGEAEGLEVREVVAQIKERFSLEGRVNDAPEETQQEILAWLSA